MNKMRLCIIFLGMLLLAAFFRLYGVNWDQSQHLHPDERFLTMVTQAIQWPKDIFEYLDASTSTMNPHNQGFGFFVYGTFPIFFTRIITDIFHKTTYEGITIIGRQLSALFDLGTVLLVFLIAKQIYPKFKNQSSKSKKNNLKIGNWNLFGIWDLGFGIFPILAMFLYTAMVLPIQLSHFYAVDTYLTFFITLTFYFLFNILRGKDLRTSQCIGMGVALGLATSSKVTAVFTLPIILIGLLYWLIRYKSVKSFVCNGIFFTVAFYLTLRLGQPYLFAKPDLLDLHPNTKVLENWKQLKTFDDPTGGFPPGVQWITTKPFIFPLKNMVYWGLGLPMGIVFVLSITYYILRIVQDLKTSIKRKKYSALDTKYVIRVLMMLWILFLFFYQGAQFVKALRYFFPMYPFIAVISSDFLTRLFNRMQQNYSKRIWLLGYWVTGLLVFLYPLAFLSIYSHDHSRVAASKWIYNNIPVGIFKSDEVWDDGLPMSLPQDGYYHEKYTGVEFPLYWPDDQHKWDLMIKNLSKIDYIFETSNRLYGSIMTYPEKYPISIKYYNALFDGSLGFQKVAEFTSRPNIPIPFIKWCINLPGARYGIVARPTQQCDEQGISLVDDYADETFTVYDHPKVSIFKKVKTVDYRSLLQLL